MEDYFEYQNDTKQTQSHNAHKSQLSLDWKSILDAVFDIISVLVGEKLIETPSDSQSVQGVNYGRILMIRHDSRVKYKQNRCDQLKCDVTLRLNHGDDPNQYW